jgi:RimJ/RimL family protein N-acetyltransferase
MQTEWTGGTIRIRPYRPDVDEAHCAAVRESLDAPGEWLAWAHAEYSPSDSAAWIASRPEAWAKGEVYSFVAEDGARSRLLGGSGLDHLNETHRLANLGY